MRKKDRERDIERGSRERERERENIESERGGGREIALRDILCQRVFLYI